MTTDEMVALRQSGKSLREIGAMVGITRQAVHQRLAKAANRFGFSQSTASLIKRGLR